MNPGKPFRTVSCGLFAGAALLIASGAALSQTQPSDADIINAIPAPPVEQPKGLEAAPAPAPEATAPAVTPAPQTATTPAATVAPAMSPEEIKKLTGKKLVEAPLADLSGADLSIAEKLRETLASNSNRYFTRKEERDAAEVFYRDRGFKPLWIENGAAAPRTTAAVKYLGGLDADGMNPDDYPAPDFKLAEADKLAEQELKFTAEVLEFTRHASMGRVHWSRVSKDILYKHDGFAPSETLTKLAAANDMPAFLASFHPPHELYRQLKAQLAGLRGVNEKTPVRIPNGPLIRYNAKKPQEDKRVPLLRERLELAAKDDIVFDEELRDAVIAFQKANKITSGGIVGPQTVATMNGGINSEKKVDIVIANMERLRWMPRDLGDAHVITNIPEYMLHVYNNGQEVWKTRIVVGKPNLATPIITQEMKFITVNPTWNVPPSIIANEYLPALRQDPDALTRIGLRVTRRADGTIHVYQPPGDANALGRIRFNFPNKFLVYQHDTPTKHLFAHDQRAYSHGCMRVQDPLKYAEVLLNIARPGETWTTDRVRRMYGQAEQNIQFQKEIPVHIVYQTAAVENGELIIRKDIYGRDARLIQVMNARGNDRRTLDVAIEHRDPSPTRQSLRLDSYDGDHRGGRGFDFFGLFRSY